MYVDVSQNYELSNSISSSPEGDIISISVDSQITSRYLAPSEASVFRLDALA